jgi:hypothetical protein
MMLALFCLLDDDDEEGPGKPGGTEMKLGHISFWLMLMM